MRQKIIILTAIFFLLWLIKGQAQQDTVKTVEHNPVVFGRIYPGFTTTFAENSHTTNSFDMNTALLGAKANFGNKVCVILSYDVTKTTGDILVKDSNYNAMQVSWYKGSDYTAFLKQAEINYKPFKSLELAIGQLLNEQYLTIQDIFWGYRYVAFTFQERYKYGFPADFGFRMAYNKNKLRLSVTVSNGEGPLYRQDSNGLMMYALNVEYKPSQHWIFKVYGDVYPDDDHTCRQTLSLFGGYSIEKFRMGIESCWVQNDLWNTSNDYEGFSGFVSYCLNKKWSVFVREDYLVQSLYYKNTSFSIVGTQYEINQNISVSINGRSFLNSYIKQAQLCLNVGAKF